MTVIYGNYGGLNDNCSPKSQTSEDLLPSWCLLGDV